MCVCMTIIINIITSLSYHYHYYYYYYYIIIVLLHHHHYYYLHCPQSVSEAKFHQNLRSPLDRLKK